MQIHWQPHSGPQTQALTRPEFEVLYGGARGGGKTDAGFAWLMRHIDNPRYRFLVIRRNAEDLSDWLDRAKSFYAPARAVITGRPATIRFPSGAMGRVGHLKDENAFDHYQGHEYQRILIEELTQIPREERYLKLISSCRSTVDGIKSQVFCTTNPGGPGHLWVKQRFRVSQGSGVRHIDPISGKTRVFISARLTDNPTLMAKDPEYEAYLRSLPEKTRKAWLEGSWDVFEGQFFDSFDTNLHVCQPFEIPKDWARYIGLDYGYTAPSAVGWFAVSPEGITYQYRELYRTGLTFESLKQEILKLNKGEKIELAMVDPALRAKGQGTGIVGLEELNKDQSQISFIPADNDRINGWGRLREYYRPRKDSEGNEYAWLKIFSTCRETIRSVPELVHDPHRVEDLDTDGDDHCADMQRYFVMGRPMPADPKDAFLQEARTMNHHSYQYQLRKRVMNGEDVYEDFEFFEEEEEDNSY